MSGSNQNPENKGGEKPSEDASQVKRDIDLATDVFLALGQAPSPPRNEKWTALQEQITREVKQDTSPSPPNPPGSKLKAFIDKLEQTKYNPPLHSETKEIEINGKSKKVRITVRNTAEGDLKDFPVDFKSTLQIRALQRTRAAIELIKARALDPLSPEQQAQMDIQASALEQKALDWIEKWDQGEPIPALETKVQNLEKTLTQSEERLVSLKKNLTESEELITELKENSTDKKNWARKSVFDFDQSKEAREEDRTNSQIAQDNLKLAQKSSKELKKEIKAEQEKLKTTQKELKETKKELFKANDKMFQCYLEDLTLHVGGVVDPENFNGDAEKRAIAYNQVFEELDQVEPFVTWQDDRQAIVSFMREPVLDKKGNPKLDSQGNPLEKVQMQAEDPCHALTPNQLAEFYKVYAPIMKGKEPEWFNGLTSVEQSMLKAITKKAFETGDFSILEKTLPSGLRKIPGAANFTNCTALTLVQKKEGEFQDSNGQGYDARSVHAVIRMSTPLPVTMNASGPVKLKIAKQNNEQMFEAVVSHKTDEYMHSWSLENTEGTEQDPIRIPIAVSSLLSSLGTLDNEKDPLFHGNVANNNGEMIRVKSMAVNTLADKYPGPRQIVGADGKPHWVQYDFIKQNHELSAVRNTPIGDPDVDNQNKKAGMKLLESFNQHIDNLFSKGEQLSKQDMDDIAPLEQIAASAAGIAHYREDFSKVEDSKINFMKANLATMQTLAGKAKLQAFLCKRAGNTSEALKLAIRQEQDLRLSAEALVQFLELKQTRIDVLGREVPVIKNQRDRKALGNPDDRNRELFSASLESFVVTQMHGIYAPACKSSNDRRGLLENVHVEAMRQIYDETGVLPRYDDPPELRQKFIEKMAKILETGFAGETVAANCPGVFGLKNESVPGFGQLWPRDLAKVMEERGFASYNGNLCKLNAIASKKNSLNADKGKTFFPKEFPLFGKGLKTLCALGAPYFAYKYVSAKMKNYQKRDKQTKRYKEVNKEREAAEVSATAERRKAELGAQTKAQELAEKNEISIAALTGENKHDDTAAAALFETADGLTALNPTELKATPPSTNSPSPIEATPAGEPIEPSQPPKKSMDGSFATTPPASASLAPYTRLSASVAGTTPISSPIDFKAEPSVSPVEEKHALSVPASSISRFSVSMRSHSIDEKSTGISLKPLNAKEVFDKLTKLENDSNGPDLDKRILENDSNGPDLDKRIQAINDAKTNLQLLDEDKSKTPSEINQAIARSVKTIYFLKETGSTTSTTSKNPAAAAAVIYALSASGNRGILTLSGGTIEQHIRACKTASKLGFSGVQSDLLLASKDVTIQGKIKTLQDAKFEVEPYPHVPGWAVKGTAAHHSPPTMPTTKTLATDGKSTGPSYGMTSST